MKTETTIESPAIPPLPPAAGSAEMLKLPNDTKAKQVIGPNGIRSVPEQVAVLAMPSHKEESIGRFVICIMNNKPFIRHSTSKGLCTKVLVVDEKEIEIDLVRVLPADEV